MKKLFVLLLFLSFCGSIFSQKTNNTPGPLPLDFSDYINWIDENPTLEEMEKITRETRFRYEGRLNDDGEKDGVWKYYKENGELILEETFKDGVLDGIRKKYNLKGKVYLEENYTEGGKRRTFKYYDVDYGKVSFEGSVLIGNYDIQIEDGVYRWYEDYNKSFELEKEVWYDRGVMKKEIKVTGLTGPYSVYFDTITKYVHDYYGKSEVISGLEVWKNNVLRSSLVNLNPYEEKVNERVWLITKYYQNGNTKEMGESSDGKKRGLWKFYNQDGTLKEDKTYLDGEEVKN